jgi:predicted nucleotidyltransferase
MNAQSTIDRLKAMQPELARSGVAALFLFGSFARGEADEDSDVDLAFEIDDAFDSGFSLLDQAKLQNLLEEKLGRKVDFLERHAIHRDLRPRIEREMVRVF